MTDHLGQLEASRIEALEARLAAAEARIAALEGGGTLSTVIVGNSPTMPPTPLGKDATCSYCGGALWVCRGQHNVC